MKYRKKPIVIKAMQYTGDNFDEIDKFIEGSSPTDRKIHEVIEEEQFYDGSGDPEVIGKRLEIETLEGNMKADVNDYIIIGVQGEFYPCKPDIFEQTYEKV